MKMLQCTCHSGAQICSVTCVDLNHGNITVGDTFCNSIIRSEEESSGINQCNTGWRTGPWSMVYTFYYNVLKNYLLCSVPAHVKVEVRYVRWNVSRMGLLSQMVNVMTIFNRYLSNHAMNMSHVFVS